MDRATKVAAVVIVILVAAGAAIYFMNEHPGSDIVYHDTLDALGSYGSEGDVVSECTFDEPGFTFIGWKRPPTAAAPPTCRATESVRKARSTSTPNG